MKSNTFVVIMAGGIGSRFWPGSRVSRPKQFLDIMGVGKSLIRMTYERFLDICPSENIYVLTNEMYRSLVKEHLPELDYNQILCEPSRNNTAPCIAYAAFKLYGLNPDANFIVAPSDHIILDEPVFVHTVKKGLAFTAENDALLTLGIKPSRPDTGYGYIHFNNDPNPEGICKVLQFTEKPNLDVAKQFLSSGEYLWNAGIFIWSAKNLLKAFQNNTPELYNLFADIQQHLNTSNEQNIINQHYPNTPNISIDYAVMEKAPNIYTIPSDFGWSDLGTWASLYSEYEKNEDANALFGDNILAIETKNCLIRIPKDKLLVVKGLEDFIVIDDDDVLLIWPKSEEQEIKKVTNTIEKLKGNKYL